LYNPSLTSFLLKEDKAKTTLLSPSREKFLPKENIERSASKTPDTLIAHSYIELTTENMDKR